jgi:ketosteroid isomerase-like protein
MYLSVKAVLLCVSMVSVAVAETKSNSDAAREILALEKAAMERWSKGDVEGYLHSSSDEVTYFDPFTAKRLNGLPELSTLYRSFAGQFHFDRFEFADPKIQLSGNVAVLTYNLITYVGSKEERWNATMVYQNTRGKWKIIHTHMSLTQPKIVEKPEN